MTSTVTNTFGPASTTEDVLKGIDLRGKRMLVTGVSAGLGIETARSLAAHGAHVIGAARDFTKAEKATEPVHKHGTDGGGSFELVELDLASLKSVRTCADRLLAKGDPFDVIIANAGVMATPFGHTAERILSTLDFLVALPLILFTLTQPGGCFFEDWIAPFTKSGSPLLRFGSRLAERQVRI